MLVNSFLCGTILINVFLIPIQTLCEAKPFSTMDCEYEHSFYVHERCGAIVTGQYW